MADRMVYQILKLPGIIANRLNIQVFHQNYDNYNKVTYNVFEIVVIVVLVVIIMVVVVAVLFLSCDIYYDCFVLNYRQH